MSVIRKFSLLFVFGISNLFGVTSHADYVHYTLDNVILDDNTQMTGKFSWTFDPGDYEGGSGQFIVLDIPWTAHNEDDIVSTIDVTESIEITFDGNLHDDGIDITLVLVEPLTPTTSSLIDLDPTASKYSIGGNGFHDGFFLSGSIAPVVSVPEPAALYFFLIGVALLGLAFERRRL